MSPFSKKIHGFEIGMICQWCMSKIFSQVIIVRIVSIKLLFQRYLMKGSIFLWKIWFLSYLIVSMILEVRVVKFCVPEHKIMICLAFVYQSPVIMDHIVIEVKRAGISWSLSWAKILLKLASWAEPSWSQFVIYWAELNRAGKNGQNCELSPSSFHLYIVRAFLSVFWIHFNLKD